MASVASAPVARRKKTNNVYGRTARPAFGANQVNFFDDDEPVKEPAFKRIKSANASLPQRQYPVEVKRAVTSIVPARPTAVVATQVKRVDKDAFDVPSSEDESNHADSRVLVPLVLRAQSELVNDRAEVVQPRSIVQPAPLQDEESFGITDTTLSLHFTSGQSPYNSTETSEVEVVGMEPAPISPPGVRKHAMSGSALERLAARKRQAISKTTAAVSTVPSQVTSSIKVPVHRKVPVTTSRENSPPLSNQLRQPQVTKPTPVEKDIFDVPSDAEPAPQAHRSLYKVRIRSRRSPVVDGVATPRKSSSTPEPLSAMLGPEKDVIDSGITVSPSADKGTDVLFTPRSDRGRFTHQERRNSVSGSGALTPKQKQLWADFLGSEDAQEAPTAATSMRRLKLHDSSDPIGKSSLVPAKRSQPCTASRRRTRAVDRLKAARLDASDSEGSESSEDADDSEMPDIEDSTARHKADPQTLAHEPPRQCTTATSQETKPVDGPRITYAKVRSHLAEDSLEGMILDLPTETPQRAAATARRVGRPAEVQTSGFDLDDDDDGTAKGVRTIHELRAAGRSTRVMGEIGDLLQEIADHTQGSRSRRRAALLELATKLLDPKFTQQFVGHGFEHQLLAEHGAPPDTIADFILASAYMLLAASDLSTHTLKSFQKALPWLIIQLGNQQHVGKLAKARSSNMSKAAQGDVVAFVEKLRASSGFKDRQPEILTPRLVALKTIDALVGKLRNSGNRSTLLSAADLGAIVPSSGLDTALRTSSDGLLEAELVISLLEALSTLSAVSEWPKQVMKSIGSLPSALATASDAAPHSKWLSYRLCLNVTNDPSIDHTVFAGQNAVQYILNDIVSGFAALQNPTVTLEEISEETMALNLDLLVLAIGIMVNLAEHSAAARTKCLLPLSLPDLQNAISIFTTGQDKLEDAESELESQANVALGYLAVMLANLCQDAEVRHIIAQALPGGTLAVLIGAIEEFVLYHEKVDGLSFEGAEGQEVWSVFTGRLQEVLGRLKGGKM
ncbi:hypothetical protein B0A48_10268 [Cryoendolithus antarcticus]|uniref:Wings apart-like protein C-terminal domain-containing protein n=1 Tax=Cryoendolithus antarcticus TaxID=1507870 RepID=A0A1V8SWR8_9PEZI|nr:hypothetical protein B0A48_10268 [Cryoendolithus antarcticus]